MKPTKISIIYLFSFYCLTIFAQEDIFPYNPRPARPVIHPYIDSTNIRIQYRQLAVNDTSNSENKKEEIMLLQVGNNVSKYANFHRFLADSLYGVLVEKKTAQSVAHNKVFPLKTGTSSIKIFKNYPTGKITTIDRVPFDAYTFEEDMQSPNWVLKPDTLTVCGYLCYKAKTKLFGRNYTAWYAPEIAISDGPWKLFGLPGLILKAEDDKKEYQFECIAIEKTTWGDTIYGLSYSSIKTTKKKFLDLQKKYYSSPAAFVGASNMVQSPLPASASKSRPYNPIELSE